MFQRLAIPSCISVCLEWWWYEIMILLCGLLLNHWVTVAFYGCSDSNHGFDLHFLIFFKLWCVPKNKEKLAAIVGLYFSFILGFLALVVAVMVTKIWESMFTQDIEIIALTSIILPIIRLFELRNCPQTIDCGVLRGTTWRKLGANKNLSCFSLWESLHQNKVYYIKF